MYRISYAFGLSVSIGHSAAKGRRRQNISPPNMKRSWSGRFGWRQGAEGPPAANYGRGGEGAASFIVPNRWRAI